ncbi:hypothetical protein [Aquamicrobium ahrensii]|uniref:Molecular chaperone DnaJ n=1 Tax=Aquamicrobium ahrensii TaxID=469551 RepID=A0ABV2KJF6_9HYPH
MDFASLLDDLFVSAGEDQPMPATATMPFDYLAVVDELHSGRIKVSEEALVAQYRDSGVDLGSEFAALLDQAKAALGDAESARQPILPELAPVDAESIAAELGLGRPGVDLRAVRRRFALTNHPDRVPPHLRQRAMIRMQIANMLIDEAAGAKNRR